MKKNHKDLSVAIVGYTGETGKKILNEIIKNNLFKRVVLIGRRLYGIDLCLNNRIEQHVIDFDHLENYEYLFMELDAVYCCLGASLQKDNILQKVNYDYVHNTAFLASKNGCKQFHLISSWGSCPTSKLTYFKIKGKIEIAVSDLKFDRVFIYRPRFLIGKDRKKNQPLKRIFFKAIKPITSFDPTLATTNVSHLAKTMIYNTFIDKKLVNKINFIDNEHIYKSVNDYKEYF